LTGKEVNELYIHTVIWGEPELESPVERSYGVNEKAESRGGNSKRLMAVLGKWA